MIWITVSIREDMSVYVAGIWSEGHAHYPGGAAVPHRTKFWGMRWRGGGGGMLRNILS